MLNRIKQAASSVSESVGDPLGAGFERLKKPVDDLAASAEWLEKLGYKLGEIELQFSLPPNVILHLLRVAAETIGPTQLQVDPVDLTGFGPGARVGHLGHAPSWMRRANRQGVSRPLEEAFWRIAAA